MGHPMTRKRDAARLTVARQARDANDLKQLIDMLGLWPHQDDAAEQTAQIPTQFHSRFKQTRW
jgi:hypothetical protein